MPQVIPRAAALEQRVAEAFRHARWKVRRPSHAGRNEADLVVRHRDRSYAVEVKSAAEGRRDRLVPLLAQAILQAQAFARQAEEPLAPLAVVGADRISESLVRDLESFAREYAPGVAVGVVDLEGFQWFHGPGLESLNAPRGRAEKRVRVRVSEHPVSHLFSDLNQWMLKVLLAPGIPPNLLNAPRGNYRNASQLAEAANVSVMSAFRFLRQLRVEGFLDDSSDALEVVRIDALLRRWQADHLGPVREVPMRWVLRGDPERQLRDAVCDWAARPVAGSIVHPRACLGLFAAADALGIGFVRGVPPHLYLERLEAKALQQLGLSLEPAGAAPDVVVRLPAARESIFRGAVDRGGVPVSDALQVWLDVYAHPSRGKEQADLIHRRVLQPILKKLQA